MNDSPISKVVQSLYHVTGCEPKPSRKGYMSICPAHDDHNPSLSITVGDEGQVLMHCHAGCATRDILASISLSMADLYPDDPGWNPSSHPNGSNRSDYATVEQAIQGIVPLIQEQHGSDWILAEKYCYRDSLGHEVSWVLRFQPPDRTDKTFRPIHRTGKGWQIGDPPGQWTLYNLPELQGASRVYLVEGEKAVEAMRSIGLVATTSAHGAKAASKTDWRPLAGKEVIRSPDNNDAGEKYVGDASAIITRLDPPATVKTIRLPDLPDGGDIVDYLDARECVEPDEIRAGIEAMADNAPLDSIPAPIEGDLAGIEFQPIPASQLGSGEQITWTWFGWLAPGYVTLLIGLWKAGKTTLAAHLLKAMAEGGDIGGIIRPARCLVVAEEGPGLWARRRNEIGIGDNVHFLIRHFKGRPSRAQWTKFVTQIAQLVSTNGYNVVIFDTWQSISPCHDENDAAVMMGALTPLHLITEAGAAVLLIHHPRKGEGDRGQASRGSGALPGFVDTIMELRRFDPQSADDNRRVLKGLSRFDETPSELVLELRKDGYHTIGSSADAKQHDRLAVITEILAESGKELDADQIREAWPKDGVPKPGERTLKADLKFGYECQRWHRLGQGVRSDPYRYAQFDSCTGQVLSAGIESEEDDVPF